MNLSHSKFDLEKSREIVEICKDLHAKNFLAAADGNVSFRISDEEILITPSGVAKCRMKPDEMCVVKLDGSVVRGRPSSESFMHLTVFRDRPEAKAVVHAHPPHAIAWSIARPELKSLPNECLSELILACGDVPIVPYARPSSEEMGHYLKEHLAGGVRNMILARHGAISWGESLVEAYNGIERVDHAAYILTVSHQLGGATNLSDSEVSRLKEMRKNIGPRTF